jgi:hypothetical protein
MDDPAGATVGKRSPLAHVSPIERESRSVAVGIAPRPSGVSSA